MSDNEQNKPTEPQDPDVSLRDRRRILEELTPNVSAKQLSEQLARMKREAEDSASEDSAAEGNAMNNSAGSSSQPHESDQNNHQSETSPESSENQPAASDVSMTDEPRLSTLETRAVIISNEPVSPTEKPQSSAVNETKPEMPAAPPPNTPAGTEEPSAEIALTSEQPETPTDTALLTDEKSQRPAQTVKSSTSQLPDVSTQSSSEENAADSGDESTAEPEESNGQDAKPEPTMASATSDVDELEDSLNKELLSKHDTAILANKPQVRRALQQQATGEHQTASLGENREIILVIRGMVERLILPDDKRIILGRTDVKSRFLPDVDLTPYGALDRGVSREHASLHLQGDRLFVTDLNSTNGTYLAGKKLDPHTPSILRKGDELLLGRLPVQVLFR